MLGEHTVLVTDEEDAAIKGHGMPVPNAQGKLKIKPAKSLVPEKYATATDSPLHFTVQEGNNKNDIELKD